VLFSLASAFTLNSAFAIYIHRFLKFLHSSVYFKLTLEKMHMCIFLYSLTSVYICASEVLFVCLFRQDLSMEPSLASNL
jgi:hypothetical protein